MTGDQLNKRIRNAQQCHRHLHLQSLSIYYYQDAFRLKVGKDSELKLGKDKKLLSWLDHILDVVLGWVIGWSLLILFIGFIGWLLLQAWRTWGPLFEVAAARNDEPWNLISVNGATGGKFENKQACEWASQELRTRGVNSFCSPVRIPKESSFGKIERDLWEEVFGKKK